MYVIHYKNFYRSHQIKKD